MSAKRLTFLARDSTAQMTINDLFTQLRTLFKFTDQKLVEVVAMSGRTVSLSELGKYAKKVTAKEDVSGKEALLQAYLNGLIIHRRGQPAAPSAIQQEPALTNNRVLTKLRIIFELKMDDVLEIFQATPYPVTKQELSAYSRKSSNKHYRECSDDVLKAFISVLRKAPSEKLQP